MEDPGKVQGDLWEIETGRSERSEEGTGRSMELRGDSGTPSPEEIFRSKKFLVINPSIHSITPHYALYFLVILFPEPHEPPVAHLRPKQSPKTFGNFQRRDRPPRRERVLSRFLLQHRQEERLLQRKNDTSRWVLHAHSSSRRVFPGY
jgi:hypothetical protein